MDKILHLLGIARKAGRLEAGEEPVGACARAHQARLILVTGDAAENSARRAAHFAEAGQVPWVCLPHSKGEVGAAVGRSACAMLAVTDAGLASALAEQLAQREPERYGPVAEELARKAERVLQRQRERRAHEKNLQRGGKKPWAAPPPTRERPPQAEKRSPSQGGGPLTGKKKKS